MSESTILACPACNRKNRVPTERLAEGPTCGNCKAPLFTGKPLALGAKTFDIHAASDLPMVVDFWAPWCGPCRQFAPIFEQAAAQIGTRARLVKVDTEAEPGLAARFGIRSIPTLVILHRGKEITRLAGALPPAQLRQWLNQHLD